MVPPVRLVRATVDDEPLAARVHRGLTSRNVLDTRWSWVSRDALDRIVRDLRAAGRALAYLAGIATP